MKPLVAAIAVLVALAIGAAVQAQTPEIDALRVRAEQGNADAQFNLGVMYATGLDVPEDDAEAAFWYRQAAEQGHANAQFLLGLSYANGEGVLQDDAEGYCQVDEHRCDRPTRYCGRSPSWADMLGIRIGLMPQLDSAKSSHPDQYI